MLVVDEAAKLLNESKCPQALVWAALLHTDLAAEEKNIRRFLGKCGR